MSYILIAQKKSYQKVLMRALEPIVGEIEAYSDFHEVPEDKPIDAVIGVVNDNNKEKSLQFSQKYPFFSILEEEKSINMEERLNFSAFFVAPIRLGYFLEVVRSYKKNKLQQERLKPIKMGAYVLHPKNSSLQRSSVDDMARLTEKELAILLFLYAEKGSSVSRQRLLENVWEYAEGVETHTLETHIYRLRQKIENDPSDPDFLMTDELGYFLNF